MKELKPHGIDVGCKMEILSPKKAQPVKTIKSMMDFQGFIEFENIRTGEITTLPMRSFVSAFMNKLHGILSGDGGTDTPKSWASTVSLGASTNERSGILVGTDNSAPALGDTGLAAQLSHASFAYKQTTFVEPSLSNDDLVFEVRRLFSNTIDAGTNVYEVGLFSKFINSSAASNVNNTLLARDVFSSPIAFADNDDIRITFKFRTSPDTTGGGGVVLNFVKLIFNLMIKGNEDNTGSRLVCRTGTTPTHTYASAATAASGGPFTVRGVAAQTYVGIVAGIYTDVVDDQELAPLAKITPNVTGDDTTFTIRHTNLTLDANTISAVTNPFSSVNQFTVIRNFTNNSTVNVFIDRVGLLTRGSTDGATLGADQAFLAINKSTNLLQIDPGQTLKVTYTFQIKV